MPCLMLLRFERYFSRHWETQMITLGIFKENMETWAESIELADLGEKNYTVKLSRS